MRTTILLPDALAEAARRRALAEGRTFTSLVEEGLRAVLDKPPAAPAHRRLPVAGRRGGHPLVDLEDREQIWGALDADGPR
ncbi:MAG: hypothetical protein QM733_14025 [Ilumatobacteraceae bacterium]